MWDRNGGKSIKLNPIHAPSQLYTNLFVCSVDTFFSHPYTPPPSPRRGNTHTRTHTLGEGRLKDGHESKGGVEETDGIGNQEPLIVHAHDDGEDATCRISTPRDGQGGACTAHIPTISAGGGGE